MKKIEDWEREEAGEKRLQQLEEWLEHRPLLNKFYCHVIIGIVGLTHAEAIFSFFMDDVFCFHGCSDGHCMPADGGITESQLHDSSWFFIKFSFCACWAEKFGSLFYVYLLNIYNNETRKKV